MLIKQLRASKIIPGRIEFTLGTNFAEVSIILFDFGIT